MRKRMSQPSSLAVIPPCCKSAGRLVNDCARAVYGRQITGNYRLEGEAWIGWRIQGNALIGPDGVRWTPATLRLAQAWQQEPVQQLKREAETTANCTTCRRIAQLLAPSFPVATVKG